MQNQWPWFIWGAEKDWRLFHSAIDWIGKKKIRKRENEVQMRQRKFKSEMWIDSAVGTLLFALLIMSKDIKNGIFKIM